MSGPRDVHAAQVRILLGELEPLVTKVAEIAAAMDTTRDELKAELGGFTAKAARSIDESTARSLTTLQKSVQKTMTDEREELRKSGAKAAEAIKDQLDRRILTLTALNKDLRRRTGVYLMCGAVFAMMAGAVGGAIAARLLSGA